MSLIKTHLFQQILKVMIRYLFFLVFVFITSVSYCQDPNENITKQQITVSKSYAPELKNVNKIRSITTVDDMIISNKVTVTYNLIDVPVISTFKPNKSSPMSLKRNNLNEISFDNYFDFGIGNNGQLTLDVSSNMNIDRRQSFGLDIISSNYGDVNSTIISSNESRFIFGLDHIYSSQKMEVVHKLFLNQHKINYYGINEESSVLSDPLLLDKINTDQSRNKVSVLSNWRFYNSFLKTAMLDVDYISDSYDSNENIVDLRLEFLIPIFRMNLLVTPKISYVNTSFKEDYYNRKSIKSFYTKFETLIQLSNIEDKLKYQIGGRINLLINKSNSLANDLLLSPKVMVSYGENGSKFQPYIMLDGGIELNNYSSISDINPYVAPSLVLIPTENLYEAKLGFKSSFDSSSEINIGTHFKKNINSLLFNRLPYDPSVTYEGYRLANSYEVLYDNITQYGFFGEVSVNFSEENLFRFSIIQSNYDLDKISSPWNLPNFEGNSSIHLNPTKKLRINILARFLGKRQIEYKQVFLNQLPENALGVPKTLPSLYQIKTEINYRLESRWELYLRSQFNLSNVNSQWDNYLLNKNLFLLGIRYGFDLSF